MDNIAILDIGSARTKATIAIYKNGTLEYIKLKDETQLSSHHNEDNVIDESFVTNDLLKKLIEFKEVAIKHNCKRLLTLGTHVLRKAKNADSVSTLIKSVTGELNIIESWLEGALFFSWLKSKFKIENLAVVDIGGGSVQIALGETKDAIYSLPTGTFSLEKEFQKSKEFCSEAELNLMASHIRAEIEKQEIPQTKVDVLIMGSNCMEDFVDSSYNQAKINQHISYFQNIKVEKLNSLKVLFDQIKHKEYRELETYYPQNKFFMYGADKAFINLFEVCSYLKVDLILPTNESISTALVDTLSMKPETLERYGISFYNL